AVLDWACDRAAHEGARWVRIDIWSNNQALQRYYHDHGFTPVRTLIPTDYPATPPAPSTNAHPDSASDRLAPVIRRCVLHRTTFSFQHEATVCHVGRHTAGGR
ncbi:MAG TPA: hypothetical protein VIQ76_07970, partial [Propionibacteriaceae bacterium]